MTDCQSNIAPDCNRSNATISLTDGRVVCARCAVFSVGWVPKKEAVPSYPPRDAEFTPAHDPRDWDGIAAKQK